MCCTLRTLKIMIGILSALTFFGGLAIMGVTFNMIIQTSWLKYQSTPDQLNRLATIIAATSLTIGSLAIIFGIIGCCLTRT